MVLSYSGGCSRIWDEQQKRAGSGGWFNIMMSSYQYTSRKSHCGDKTILRPSYLHSGISYTGKTSLYWIRAQVLVVMNAASYYLCDVIVMPVYSSLKDQKGFHIKIQDTVRQVVLEGPVIFCFPFSGENYPRVPPLAPTLLGSMSQNVYEFIT